MNATVAKCDQSTLAATVAGEDIVRGDFVTVLDETYDMPTSCWLGSDPSLSDNNVVKVNMIPQDAGTPRKVTGVCLPFVYTKTIYGGLDTLDTRRQRLVRLDYRCARQVWKKARKQFKND
ncbi:hypothetical protein [Stratiformator vulcanicus]|uniref:Uncharacterized protein n=1 Tax=Stratiformator vulcanicus TaxID=2527980 RepID=A0A517R2Y2_9PLAN|nr:hypothetical protein [Stratiformator vulcanicus]QDT38203.1 hypothetical protein Pan189_25930 [Stratiformator vulcanicus]